ncbi:MAG: hypothetical protein MMC33_009639 [Icmadophila ericetorum]|nr:hypothetical protein [Icmadophila ericetorum]
MSLSDIQAIFQSIQKDSAQNPSSIIDRLAALKAAAALLVPSKQANVSLKETNLADAKQASYTNLLTLLPSRETIGVGDATEDESLANAIHGMAAQQDICRGRLVAVEEAIKEKTELLGISFEALKVAEEEVGRMEKEMMGVEELVEQLKADSKNLQKILGR